jgi:hypothetical protein
MKDEYIRSLSSWLSCFMTILVITTVLAGCDNTETEEALVLPPPSLVLLTSVQPTVQPTVAPTIMLTPTLEILGPDYLNIDIKAGPIDLPLELQIPSLKVNAPMLGVGLTSGNLMDAPKGPIDDPIWHKAYWYRGSGIPGEPGTATIAGHVTNHTGPEIFANLEDLNPGDLIIIHIKDSTVDIRFVVDQVEIYSIEESSDPAILTKIFGSGPLAGTGPQPAPDGLSHLTLVTCAGGITGGAFNHHTVVYATRSN